MVAYAALAQVVVFAVEHVSVEGHLTVSVVTHHLVGCGERGKLVWSAQEHLYLLYIADLLMLIELHLYGKLIVFLVAMRRTMACYSMEAIDTRRKSNIPS